MKKIAVILIFFICAILYFLLSEPCVPAPSQTTRALWIETTSNLYLLKDRESIAALLDKAREAGFNAVIPEAKNAFGCALYQSKIAPKINDLNVSGLLDNCPAECPLSNLPADLIINPNFDILQVIIEEARPRNMKVMAAVNIFSEGLNALKLGPAFIHPEWQSIFYAGNKQFIPSSEYGLLTFVNPIYPEAVEYELSILEELMKNYDIDGLILDRARYANIYADFSLLSRESFSKTLDRPIENWPEDIIRVYLTETGYGFKKGPLFNEWISFRAQNIKNFMIKARRKQQETKPNILFMNYVAGWYPYYYGEGVNWAAEGYEPLYAWTDKNWPKAGLADLFDGLIVGVYHRRLTKDEAWRDGVAEWQSIEGNIHLAQKITQDKTKIIPAIFLKIHKPDEIKRIVKIVEDSTPEGAIMIFDLSHLEKNDKFWQEIKKALQ